MAWHCHWLTFDGSSDHLALAPALAFFLVYKLTCFVWKSSVLNSNSNGNIFGLLYSSYLYFEWVKIASLCLCFCVFIFLSCAAKNSACHLGISRLLLYRFRGHNMTNKEYALRRGVQWTFSIHSTYLLKNQSQNKKLSGSVWICFNTQTTFNLFYMAHFDKCKNLQYLRTKAYLILITFVYLKIIFRNV